MIGKVPPRRLKPGDELVCKWLNEVRDAAIEGSIASLGAGLKGSPTPTGWALGVDIHQGTLRPGVTSSLITARVGNNMGSGSVDLYTMNSPPAITSDSETVTAYSISSVAAGIPSGTYCMVQMDANGNWWITTADCT